LYINPAILKLASLEENGVEYVDKTRAAVKSINSKMKYFYDFEFTQDK